MSKTKKMLDTREEERNARDAPSRSLKMLRRACLRRPICELIRMVAITVEDVDAVNRDGDAEIVDDSKMMIRGTRAIRGVDRRRIGLRSTPLI